MIFNLPTKIFEEENCIWNHRVEMAMVGTNAFIVTGKNSSKKNGSLEDLINALKDQNIEYIIFDDIEENPSVETVMKASKIAKENEIDFVIGLGGGSPIDAAKAVAIMTSNYDKGSSYLYDLNAVKEIKGREEVYYLPVIAIPTTCGTGSEATGVSVLTVHEKRTKASLPHRIFPKLALVDGKYLAFAPKQVIIATAVDALGHMIESYINSGATDYSKMFVDKGLSIWGRSRGYLEYLMAESQVDKSYEDSTKEDLAMEDLTMEDSTMDHYRNLMNASTLAGMAIAHDGTTLPHSLSYILTYEFGIAHGKAIGCFLPGYMAEANEQDRKHILEMAGFSSFEDFESFIKKSCNVGEIPEDIMERTIQSVVNNQAKLKTCPFFVNEEVVRRIANI